MTIEAILTSIDTKLGVLIQFAGRADVITDAGGPAIAGAGAESAVAQRVDAAIAAAGGVAGDAAPKRGRGRPTAKTEPVSTPAAPAAAVPEVDPFGIETVIAGPTRTLDDVRAGLIVHQAKNSQAAALKLVKDTTGAETLAQLKQEDYGKLFKAAVPADKLELSDVRDVLVRANERSANSGLEVLKAFGAKTITDLTEDKFVAAIIRAHGVR